MATARPALARIVLAAGLLCSTSIFPMPPAAAAAVEPSPAPAAPWLSSPAFATPAPEVMAAVAALPVPANAPIEILFSETSIIFDPEGRQTSTTRMLYRILTAGGMERAGSVHDSWSPWRQRRPVIRARVITAGGVAHDLDPATLSDGPLTRLEPNLFSDMRALEGPLPAVAPGAIVELEMVETDDAPLFRAGTVTTIRVGGEFPVRRARVRIAAPETLPLTVASHPSGAFHETAQDGEGMRRRVLELESFQPPETPEAFLPPDQDASPLVSIATGSSWSSIAGEYAAIVERQIADARLGPAVRGAIRGAGTDAGKILALVRFLHDSVRYTGVEFGLAGIVPEKPSVTLGRKYGDCKDKSALLVALLREAGIPAHLALLQTGMDADVDPELPGLGRFDHAIVRVDTDPPTWIDATSQYSDPGILMPGVSGRLALIVREGQSSLDRIPEARPADHRSAEVREFFLAEEGPARVVETTRAQGLFAAEYRQNQATGNQDGLTRQFEEYARTTYAAGKLDRFTASSPAALGEAFELRLEMSGVGVGESTGDAIQVPIPLAELAGWLMQSVPPRQPEGDMARGAGQRSPDPDRRGDFILPRPHVTEFRYVIHPPAGFASLPLPGAVDRPLGPARLTAGFQAAADGSVQVDARLDTGAPRWTASEYEAARRALHDLVREEAWIVSFEQMGSAHLKAGRLKEAVEQFRALAARHPAESLHQRQISRVLLAAGFGLAARQAASRGVELEPLNSAAHQGLGYALLHDALGRELRQGSDIEGAIRELRKAKEIDPKNLPARALLALALEHDAEGGRYTPKSRSDEAIEEYLAIRRDLGETSADGSLLQCLGQTGKFRELSDEASKMQESPERNGLLVAALAAVSGVDAGMSQARRMVPAEAERRQLLAAAGFLLMSFRRYPESAPFLEEALHDAPSGSRQRVLMEAVKRAKRHEDVSFDPARPDDVTREVLRRFLTTGDSGLDHALLSRYLDPDESEQRRAMSALRFILRENLGGMLTLDAVTDLVMATIETTVSPVGPDGHVVTVRNPMAPGAEAQAFLLLREADGLRLLGTGQDMSGVGGLVDHLLDEGDLAGARRWLGLARETLRGPTGDDPLAGHPMTILWKPDDPGQPAAMRAAAATLRVRPHGGEEIAPLLERLSGESADEDRWKFDEALAFAHLAARRFEPFVAHEQRVLQKFPGSPSGRALLAGGLLELRRLDEVEALARRWLAEDPRSHVALYYLVEAAARRGQVEETVRRFKALEEAGRAEPGDMNNHAWFLLENGRAEEALALAERSVRDGGSAAAIHTLAAVYADVGRLGEARNTILGKIELFGGGVSDPIDAVVFGRIAEHLGETALAVETYRGALEAPGTLDASVRRIIERRLEVLKRGR